MALLFSTAAAAERIRPVLRCIGRARGAAVPHSGYLGNQLRDPAKGWVNPAPAAFLMVPFGLLPWKLAVVAFTLVLIGSLVLALRLLRVTDWRCYAAALACMPMTSSITIGTLSPLLLLAGAAAWRYRNRRLLVAAAVVGAVVTKIFLWPLFFWLI